MYSLIKFGVLTVIISNVMVFLVSLLLSLFADGVEDWNKYFAIEFSLFMTGVILYLLTNY